MAAITVTRCRDCPLGSHIEYGVFCGLQQEMHRGTGFPHRCPLVTGAVTVKLGDTLREEAIERQRTNKVEQEALRRLLDELTGGTQAAPPSPKPP